MTTHRYSLAIGPAAPAFGSWNWIGAGLASVLADRHDVVTFTDDVPQCDVVVFVKFKPPVEALRELALRSAVVFCPVDIYGSAADIDADWESLRLCDLVITHCERLAKYFRGYAPVEYLDHHVRFTAPMPSEPRADGPIVWIGNRSNVAPVAEWVNHHPLPAELWVLTDSPDGVTELSASELGFDTRTSIRVERWTPERHIEWTGLARAAIEVKGSDFRSRHKSPAKINDFIASGIPVAVNLEAASRVHHAARGFDLAAVGDSETLLSTDYFAATQAYGRQLRSVLTLQQVASRFESLVGRTIAARRG